MQRSDLNEFEMTAILGRNLLYLRKSGPQRLSQKTVARVLNLPLKTIRNSESGRYCPSAYALYRLACFYGYTVEELLTIPIIERVNNFE